MIDGIAVKKAVKDIAATGALESDEALAFEAAALGVDFESVHATVHQIAPYAPEAFIAGFLTGVKVRETR